MTTTADTKPAAYASVLHRLANGQELTGPELIALPEYDAAADCVFDCFTEPHYAIDLVTGVIDAAGRLAAEVKSELSPACLQDFVDTHPQGIAECFRKAIEGSHILPHEPLPEFVRNTLWRIGMAADLAVKLKEQTDG